MMLSNLTKFRNYYNGVQHLPKILLIYQNTNFLTSVKTEITFNWSKNYCCQK